MHTSIYVYTVYITADQPVRRWDGSRSKHKPASPGNSSILHEEEEEERREVDEKYAKPYKLAEAKQNALYKLRVL
jgi:hypothetical protein